MSERKVLGIVTDAKKLVTRMDKKRASRLNGLVIEFETNDTITDDTVIYLKFGDKHKPFNVREVEIVGSNLRGTCTEAGYYAHKLGEKPDLDLRELIGCEIELVVDKKELNQIREESCWC